MFVVLEHDTTGSSVPDPGIHWDVLFEVPALPLLATWRLAHNPLTTSEPIPAERIHDHRRVYLDFEGELSGDRGHVRRLDSGRASVEHYATDTLDAELAGALLRGHMRITRAPAGGLVCSFAPRNDE